MGLARRIGLSNLYRCTHTVSTRKGGIILLHLKEIRLAQELSVPQLVERSGISRRTIHDIEKRGDCMLSTAYILATALGCTLNDLYDGPHQQAEK